MILIFAFPGSFGIRLTYSAGILTGIKNRPCVPFPPSVLIAMQITENGDHILAGFSQKGVNSSGEVHDHDATHAHGQIEARVEDGWARKRRFVCIPGTHRTKVMWPNGAELRTAVEWVQRVQWTLWNRSCCGYMYSV